MSDADPPDYLYKVQRKKLTLSQALRASKDIDPAIPKQPCGKSPPKGINFVPAVGAKYLAWTKGAYE
jgi:hypothetical protein